MAEQIVINIVRPEVGMSYRAETSEAEPADELAAYYLAFPSMAVRILHLSRDLGAPCHALVEAVANSDIARHGLS